MNPIVYNKNGQYRFTDFVGYLPEFLRSEPDVVTFLQVMSDYINNAYRNVNVTEEFELVKVCSSTDRTIVEKWMNQLNNMFRLACDRSESVLYLSVPRNNVKNNVALGNGNAEYVRTIEVDLADIVDSLPSASERIGGASAMDDGDVVYVKYRKRKLSEMVAYYYAKDSNTLIKDPKATSQDPFTETYNNPSTAVQFDVIDVGNVVCRYGGKHDDVVYYEVYFPLHVTNVKRVAESGIAKYDVNSDGKDDEIYVDYYNLTSAVNTDDGTYNTYIKFGKSKGFNWTGEIPTGMFYFRDSSAAKLTNLSGSGTMEIADTLTAPSVDRYRIKKVIKTAGTYRAYMEAFPGVYANALFYIVNGAKNCGVYRMNGDITAQSRFDDGELYIDLVNVSGNDYDRDILNDNNTLTLISIPLAASKYIINFNDSMPLVKWSNEITGLGESVIGLASNIMMQRAKITRNPLLYKGTVDRLTRDTIQLPIDLTGIVVSGNLICSTAFQNDDNVSPYYATVTSAYWDPNIDRFRLTVAPGANLNLSEIQSNPSIEIYGVTAGYLTSLAEDYAYSPESELVCFKGKWRIDIEPNDLLRVTLPMGDETKDCLLTVVKADMYKELVYVKKPAGFTFSFDVDDMLMASIERVAVDLDDRKASINKVNYVKELADGTVMAAVNNRSYEGDIYTAEDFLEHSQHFYMLANIIGSDEYSLLEMDTDVLKFVPGHAYSANQYVYNDNDKKIYKIIRQTTVQPDGTTIDSNASAEDRIVHYSVGFTEIQNSYMPYCGPVASLDYEEKPNYMGDMSEVRIPLYIKKINDVRLKYGWNQRQYVYYNDDIGVAPLDRAGFIEMYADKVSTNADRNPVELNLRKRAHVLPANAMRYGCGSQYYVLDIDSPPVAQRSDDGSWVITVKSSGHGLSDGVIVSASVDTGTGDTEAEIKEAVFNSDNAVVTVISPDVIQYTTTAPSISGYIVSLGGDDKLTVTYDRSYLDDPTAYPTEGDIVVMGAELCSTSQVLDYDHRFDTYPKVGDAEIYVGGTTYLVTSGTWKVIDPSELLTPTTIYCRHNLFDESTTNPTFAMGDSFVINKITVPSQGANYAEIQTSKRIPELDVDNANGIYADKGRVYIENVNQGVFCGWHTIKEIHNGGSFSIYIDTTIPVGDYIAPITNRQMTVRVGRWYKYTLSGYDWSKRSNLTSYVTTNKILEIGTNTARIKTKYAHNLNVGDHVLIDPTGSTVYNVSAANVDTIIQTKVTAVIDDYTVELERAMEPNEGGCIFRGYIINNGKNLSRLSGEYFISINGETVKLSDGDVVVTMSQVCLDERRAWRVTEKTAWIPMMDKRTFKIDRMAVDMQHNPAYDIGDDFDTESEYKYVTYADSDVSADESAYQIGWASARNYHFEHPYVENLDTTQKTELEYSSKYDYATVAPRDDMDPTFNGVPDMGYPLAERIERLAYLRDPEVIDLDLIGYLARFMGYDITAVADDIRSSNIYRNSEEREKAVRETVAHLPQFYALNGTKAGINMLMATFGLVGELITQWTNTDDPYGELIRQDEVADRMDADLKHGITTSSWVPTPHVTLDILENENFNSVLLGNEEISRMKEQIRCCKPINVVFDGIRVVYDVTIPADVQLVVGESELVDSTYLLDADDADIELNRDPCVGEDCDF